MTIGQAGHVYERTGRAPDSRARWVAVAFGLVRRTEQMRFDEEDGRLLAGIRLR